jgi:nucleoside-diphosphate-sugar epimerase
MKKPTVAITGANGFLGSALVNHFSSKGWQVIALVRNPIKSTNNVRYIEYDLAKPFDDKILDGVEYLVHAAYIKQDKRHPNAFTVNVKAAEEIIKATKKQKFKKSLFVSSMSANEYAESAYGKQKLAIEKIFSEVNSVSVRSGLIIGNGGLVKQMIDFMRSKHMVPLVGGGQQPLQIVSITDLAMTIEKLLTSNLSGVLTVATPQIYTYKEFYQAIAKHINSKILFVPVPFFILINTIRLINLMPIPIAVNSDNAFGLKNLRSADTISDLRKIHIELKDLESSLSEL